MKKTAVNVLFWVEKVTSLASSIHPLFGIVSSVAGVVHKGLLDDESLPMEKDFQSLHEKMETISEKNRKCLQEIQIKDVNDTFGKYEEFIKHQYAAFGDMVTRVKNDPTASEQHKKDFVKIYDRDGQDLSLDVFYRGVMGEGSVFGRPLLQVYLEACDRDRNIMDAGART